MVQPGTARLGSPDDEFFHKVSGRGPGFFARGLDDSVCSAARRTPAAPSALSVTLPGPDNSTDYCQAGE